jgi:hypothetical protein
MLYRNRLVEADSEAEAREKTNELASREELTGRIESRDYDVDDIVEEKSR